VCIQVIACRGGGVIQTTDSMVNLGMEKGEEDQKWPLADMEAWRVGERSACFSIAQKSRSEADTDVTDLIAGYKELIVCTK